MKYSDSLRQAIPLEWIILKKNLLSSFYNASLRNVISVNSVAKPSKCGFLKNLSRPIEKWINDQFLLKMCQKKRIELEYVIFIDF